MAKNNVSDWSTTANDNSDAGGANIAEHCAPSGINNAIRSVMAQTVREIANKGSDIASASTTALAASGTSGYVRVTGTTTITSLGTVVAGVERWVLFEDALLLTHHSTSLVLPGAANITTVAGDVACFRSEGSGNWRCMVYTRASGEVVGGFSSLTATSTDAGASAGPDVSVFRNSASPADNDLIGRYLFEARDESANRDIYGSVEGKLLDATGGTEDAEFYLKASIAGTLTTILTWGAGVGVGSVTMPGAGKLNVQSDIQLNGISLAHGVVQIVSDSETAYTTLGTILPLDNTIPQNTEGVEILAVAITPKHASSILEIDFVGSFGGFSERATAALFVDSTAAALNANGCTVTNSGQMNTIALKRVLVAGSTSARTYKIRAGSDVAADVFLNGDSISRQYGGICTAVLTVKEILPQ